MITYQIEAGTIDVSVVLRIVDSTDGTPETGVVFNTSGIDLEYRREGAASVDITEATLAALTTAHTDGGFKEIGNGYYRLDLPDAACAVGVEGVLVHGTVTGMVVIGCYIQLTVTATIADILAGFKAESATGASATTWGKALEQALATPGLITTNSPNSVEIESGISAGAGLTNDTGTQLTAITMKQALALILAALDGVLSGAAGTTITVKQAGKPAGSSRIVATVDADGNRSALTLKVPD